MYYGRGNLADEYFDKLGYTLPYRVNVADFILDLSSADVYTESRYSPCHCFPRHTHYLGHVYMAIVLYVHSLLHPWLANLS